VLYWALPRGCGEFNAGCLSFKGVDLSNALPELLSLLVKCRVMPMLHVAGVARYRILPNLSTILAVRIAGVEEAVVVLGERRLQAVLAGLAVYFRCRGLRCAFRGDLSRLDVERLKRGLDMYFVLDAGGRRVAV
jgi:hypothetical protein